jgi:hypothetical protein
MTLLWLISESQSDESTICDGKSEQVFNGYYEGKLFNI